MTVAGVPICIGGLNDPEHPSYQFAGGWLHDAQTVFSSLEQSDRLRILPLHKVFSGKRSPACCRRGSQTGVAERRLHVEIPPNQTVFLQEMRNSPLFRIATPCIRDRNRGASIAASLPAELLNPDCIKVGSRDQMEQRIPASFRDPSAYRFKPEPSAAPCGTCPHPRGVPAIWICPVYQQSRPSKSLR